jgi:hypothetical protein
MPRATSIQIYLKQGVEDDDRILALWSALKKSGRPQDTFRRMLQRGLEAMIVDGEFSDRIIEYIEESAGVNFNFKQEMRRVIPLQKKTTSNSAVPAVREEDKYFIDDDDILSQIINNEDDIEDNTNDEIKDTIKDTVKDTIKDTVKDTIKDTDEGSDDEDGDGSNKYNFIGDIM